MHQRLTFVNGEAFAKLPWLQILDLGHNYCIAGVFEDEYVPEIVEVISNNCGYEKFDTVEIYCERFSDDLGIEFCFMDEKTVINATNFVVGDPKDDDVGGIKFDENKNMEYLPYNIYMQLPNLVIYQASKCSIKGISKKNFEKLSRLKAIDLSFNQIQKISGNTLRGLESLTRFELSELFNHRFHMNRLCDWKYYRQQSNKID